MRRGFVWQLGCLVLLLVGVTTTIGAIGFLAAVTTGGIIGSSVVGRGFGVLLLVVAILGVVGIARRVRSFAAPMDDLVDAAGRIQDGDYSVRVPIRGPRDVRLLGRAFNDMSARLESTDRQRRTYLADITHELRTPLAVIQGQLEAVLDGVYPADNEHLQPIIAEARRLDGLIEDLRTLTLVETGGLTLHREAVDLAVLLNDVVASFQAAANEATVRVAATVPADLPVVEADPIRLRSVLTNLVANAVRHTPAGGSVHVAAVASGPNLLRITVTDTGPGFPPELLPHVFERFVKGSGSEGSGLGLAIARDLVVAHGGAISARNEAAGGATVEFTLPVDRDEGGG
jgi:signal transduction histidine kinase